MKRVWVVDDKIPLGSLYPRAPWPSRINKEMVADLVQRAADKWEEEEVRALCESLCADEFEATFFLSPEAMQEALRSEAKPPHAVIFDWEYLVTNAEANVVVIKELLADSFAFVQIYTHLGSDGIEPHLKELRREFGIRLLPVRAKTEVTAIELAGEIRAAWGKTIAGELADRVRKQVFAAVERTLIDLSSLPRAAITALSTTTDDLIHLVLARIRNELGTEGAAVMQSMLSGEPSPESSEALRKLMSAWYYYFPPDASVRRGDLLEMGRELGLVITPPCDLVRFNQKTGRQLTWVRVLRLDTAGVADLRKAGFKLKGVRSSITAGFDAAGDSLLYLPNVPKGFGMREPMADYVILCHALRSRRLKGTPDSEPELKYSDGGSLGRFKRRCTLAEPFASAVITKIASVVTSPGTPDLPPGEKKRLNDLFAQLASAAGTTPSGAVSTASTIVPTPEPPKR
jgi:hypothetical protein